MNGKYARLRAGVDDQQLGYTVDKRCQRHERRFPFPSERAAADRTCTRRASHRLVRFVHEGVRAPSKSPARTPALKLRLCGTGDAEAASRRSSTTLSSWAAFLLKRSSPRSAARSCTRSDEIISGPPTGCPSSRGPGSGS